MVPPQLLVPFRSLEPGPEFYNNADASHNQRGPEDDQAYFYNNADASGNCVGGDENGCGPGAIRVPMGIARIM